MTEVQEMILKIVGSSLFGRETPSVDNTNIELLLQESKAQAVFPLVFAAIQESIGISSEKDKCGILSSEEFREFSELYLRSSISGIQNIAEHSELHELMTEKDIPYSVIKGLASAMYYPDPSLRNMGDVDFLVKKDDLRKAGKVLESAGFLINHGDDDNSIHITYYRPQVSIWEMHKSVNGIPSGKAGIQIHREMDKVIDTSILANVDGALCRVPDRLHHGLILLLHTVSHLTGEGVGLRHLCDWVMFVSSMSNTEFMEIFENKLKSFGLWLFSQILTLLGIEYLGAPKRIWAMEAIENNKIDDTLLEGLMVDILSGGNFGMKDRNRYREIKYISDHRMHTVNTSTVVCQGFKTLNHKVCENYKIINKFRIFFPVGYFVEGIKYLRLLITGKRKSSGTRQMLREAAKRKKIYSELNLFRPEE